MAPPRISKEILILGPDSKPSDSNLGLDISIHSVSHNQPSDSSRFCPWISLLEQPWPIEGKPHCTCQRCYLLPFHFHPPAGTCIGCMKLLDHAIFHYVRRQTFYSHFGSIKVINWDLVSASQTGNFSNEMYCRRSFEAKIVFLLPSWDLR